MLKYEPRHVINSSIENNLFQPFSPNDLRRNYNFPTWAVGEGQTIAIICSYGNPYLLKSVEIYNKRFNLPPLDIEISYPQGEPTESNISWALETTLDVEMAHALAPKAHILLVVAKEDSLENLHQCVTYAVNRGCTIVSMSWGTVEYEKQLEVDKIFNVPGVAFLAASGDYGLPIYPAASQYVLAVGGTSLVLNNCGIRTEEELPWGNGGGGISKYEPRPYWQKMNPYGIPYTNKRMIPDVSFIADIFPGVIIYVEAPKLSDSGWMSVGGTSVSAPCFAAILASIKTYNNKLFNYQSKLYKLAGENYYTNPYGVYNDIFKGTNSFFPATLGYDCVTGLGSPNVAKLLEHYN